MKKTIVIATITGLITGNVLAYPIRIQNRTNGQIVAIIWYAGNAICKEQHVIVNAMDDGVRNDGGCCANLIQIRPTSGDAFNKKPGQVVDYTPPLTGFGISCKGSTVLVQTAADGSLIATESSDKP